MINTIEESHWKEADWNKHQVGGRKKGDDSQKLDLRELAFVKRIQKPEQKKVEKEVQQELTKLPHKVRVGILFIVILQGDGECI